MHEGDRPISEFMNPAVRCMPVDGSVADASALLTKTHLRVLPVVEAGHVVGTIEASAVASLARAAPETLERIPVAVAMTTPACTVSPPATLREVVQLMWSSNQPCVVVVDGTEIVGTYSSADASGTLLAMLTDRLGEAAFLRYADPTRDNVVTIDKRPSRSRRRGPTHTL